MAQQTAVNFILENLNEFNWNQVFEQAKQMEKEQIIQAFDIACEDKDRIGKEYYYDTYGK